jgi:TolB-like protein/DNA-binding winged helix-turn-helix (wHTH) protein/Tfp pilus assembly protein PilF
MQQALWGKAVASEPSKFQPTIKFGPDFELDPALYELRRSGRVLKLERIPMEILLLLAGERGTIVTREEIADRVWGKGVCLDVDNSINGAIRKIRQVLKDDSEQPRFIQTVTGRGYRFIAPVAKEEQKPVGRNEAEKAPRADAPGTALAATEPAAAEPVAKDARTVPEEMPSPILAEAASSRWRRWWPAFALATGLIAAVSAFLWPRLAARHEVPHGRVMLAVLPFQNLTGDPSQEYFSDGFTEEMITQLGSLDPQHLAVIARTSVMYYKNGKTPKLDQIGRELGVQYVLEGSVRRDANNVRITAELIQVRDQTHVWAREYDHELKDVLAIQSEIAREIAEEIQLTLGDHKPLTAAVRPAPSPPEYEAYDLYLKGRYLWSKRTPQGLQGAVYWFKEAIAKDPNYARAYAGLADSYAILSSYGYAPAIEYMPLARTAALKALELDDSLAEAHTSLALIAQNYDWDWQTAEKEYRRAIQLNANYATAHHWYAEFLAYQGRFDEALMESERARELDPLSLIIAADNGAIYYFSRQYDRAISRFQAVLDVDPSFGRARLIVAAYVQEGRFKEALASLEQWRRLEDGPWILAYEVYVYGRAGNPVRAQYALKQLEKAKPDSGLDPAQFLNVAYAGLDDKEKWLAWLQEAYRKHTNIPTGFKVDPLYDPLRNDPQFQDLLHRVGFAN